MLFVALSTQSSSRSILSTSACPITALAANAAVAGLGVDTGYMNRNDCCYRLRNDSVTSRRIPTKVWLTSVGATLRRVTNSIIVFRR